MKKFIKGMAVVPYLEETSVLLEEIEDYIHPSVIAEWREIAPSFCVYLKEIFIGLKAFKAGLDYKSVYRMLGWFGFENRMVYYILDLCVYFSISKDKIQQDNPWILFSKSLAEMYFLASIKEVNSALLQGFNYVCKDLAEDWWCYMRMNCSITPAVVASLEILRANQSCQEIDFQLTSLLNEQNYSLEMQDKIKKFVVYFGGREDYKEYIEKGNSCLKNRSLF